MVDSAATVARQGIIGLCLLAPNNQAIKKQAQQ
jgi:hypothetical protein